MRLYREYFEYVAIGLITLNFLIGRWLLSTIETRWIIIGVILIYGLYFPSLKEQKEAK